MKGTNPSASQKRYHDKLCTLIGCIACHKEGNFNPTVSVHHVDGRTKPLAHWKVLPLCAGHHQDGYGPVPMTAVHPYKARFQAQYGNQEDLMAECARMLVEQGVELPVEIQSITGVAHESA